MDQASSARFFRMIALGFAIAIIIVIALAIAATAAHVAVV